MGYNDSNRAPKIDEVAYVLENGKPGATWLKGKIVGINHDDQEVLVQVENATTTIKAFTNKIMFGEDPERKPEPGID